MNHQHECSTCQRRHGHLICTCPKTVRNLNNQTMRCAHCNQWVSVGPTPSPEQIARMTTIAIDRLNETVLSYRQAHEAAYQPARGGETTRYGTRDLAAVDPTGGVVTDIARIRLRGAMTVTGRLVERISDITADTTHLLTDALNRLQPATLEHTADPHHDQFPPTEAQAAVQAARDAQARRRARGEW